MTDIGHILVVENEKSMRDLLTIVLEKDGYEVNTARNGQVAVEMIEGTDYDVVLTDINMPRANGIAVLDAVNRMHPGTPVIMITAYASPETAVGRALERSPMIPYHVAFQSGHRGA